MSEKKYIFKIAKGEPIDPKLTKEKIYRIKLVAEDSQESKQEVTLDEPYFIQYKLLNNEDCSLACSPVNGLIDNIDNTKAKSFCSDDYPCINNNEVFKTVKITRSGDNKYQLMVNNRNDIHLIR
ncbi:hypothetical protein [Wolbachia pipientis]|uniref:hypothetical protein n=1 Tax=Wolbachia pipientis TaxID=955 RepID=UPI0025A317F5|nr:hypothetical protein [Wolbachia pipientis]MDM8335708.1 hypothetical protein [Wolbachia pipientis]